QRQLVDGLAIVAHGCVAEARRHDDGVTFGGLAYGVSVEIDRRLARPQHALVETLQLCCACRPAEAAFGERARRLPETRPQLVVVEQPRDSLRDFERVAAPEQDALFAVSEESAEIRRRQDDGPPRRKELG